MTTTDTTSELRQQIALLLDILLEQVEIHGPTNVLISETVDKIEALLAAKKQRWEAAARIDEATTVYNNLRTMYPEEALHHLADRIAALDGVIGEAKE